MKKGNQYEILLTISTGLVVIYLMTHNKYIIYGVVCINILTLLIKPIANLIAIGWMKLSNVMSIAGSWLFLSVIYYIFLTPIAVIYRLIKGDILKKKRSSHKKSMFVERNYEYVAEDLKHTW